MALETSNPLGKLVHKIRDAGARHKERHTPTGFQFAFADRIDQLNPAAWHSAVAGQSVFLRRDVLRHLEQHGPANVQPRYVLISRDTTPVAAIGAQVVEVCGTHLRNSRSDSSSRLSALKEVIRPARRKAAEHFQEKILIAGNLLCWGFHGIAFAPGADPSELWPAVGDALRRLRHAHRVAGQNDFVMVKDITPAQTGLASLERWSYRPLKTEPNMVLALDPSWKTYDDYLAALDAKYRRNAKDNAKKLAAADCAIEPLADLRASSARLHQLYLNVVGNASVRLVTAPENYLPGLAEVLGPDFACNVVRRGDELLGFVTMIRDGDTAIGYYIGFDREAAASGIPIYLRLLHSTIATAIDWRCKRLSLGRTALEPKAALGAKPEPMSVYLRHRFPLMNWLLRGVINAVPHTEAPERSPFKAATKSAG